ncbi:MAG: WD40 repeat domain-containing protein [Gemmataceae bacterium]
MSARCFAVFVVAQILATASTATAQPRTDLFGDPLPDGALLRLGTVGFRVPRLGGIGFRPSGELVAITENLNLVVWPADGSPKATVTRLAAATAYGKTAVISANGRFAATGLQNRVVVWDVSGDRSVEYLSRETKNVLRLCFSADGASLVVQDVWQGTSRLRLCKLAAKTWEELPADVQSADSLSFAADRKSLVVRGFSSVVVIDTVTRTVRFKPELPRLHVRSAALSPDGKTLVVLPSTSIRGAVLAVQFLSVDTGKAVAGMKLPAGAAHFMCFAPDGKTLLLGGRQSLREWDPVAGKLISEIPGPAESPPVYSADGRRLASHSRSAVLLADVASGRPVHPELINGGHTAEVIGVAVSPDGKLIATNSFDSEIRVWSVESGRPLSRVRAPWGNDQRIAFLPDSRSFITVAEDYVTPVVYEAASGRELRRFAVTAEMAKEDMTGDVQLSADGKTLTTASRPARGGKPYSVRWDVASGRVTERTEVAANIRMLLENADGAYSPDGRWLVQYGTATCTGLSGSVQIIPPAESGWTLPKFSDDGRLVTLSRTPRRETSDDWDRSSVVVFDLAAMAPIGEVPFKGRVLRHAQSPDGRRLAVVGLEETIVWDLLSKKAVGRFRAEGFIGYSPALAFTPDGRRLITGHDDCTALVWEVPPPASGGALSPADLDAAWASLADPAAAKGFEAVCRLADAPAQAIQILKDRLRPIAAPPTTEIQPLLTDLGSSQFAVREAADRKLRAYGDHIEALLREALKTNSPAEAKKRMEAILAGFAVLAAPEGEVLRAVRAVWALERIGTPEARRLLAELATGAESARLTREAKMALERMR